MKKYFLLLILCTFSVISFGQIKESQAIDNIFTEWNKANVPGCALGIIKDGKLIYAKGYGLANMEYEIPNSPNSVFRIGSTSKQFTAACIVLLAERGKLSLDNTLKEYFPEFPEYAKKITIKHLLNHTSGIRDYLQLAYLKGYGNDDFYTNESIMDWLINQSDLNFSPGDEFIYSNSGYWLLGQIVKEVSGVNMADFAKKEIFEPLGMSDTHFHNDHTQIVKNRASGYVPSGNDSYKISMTTLDMIGDGGIFTTINDIKKWDDTFYNSTVLSKIFWKMMTQKGVLNNGEVIVYASGLFIEKYKGLNVINHGGAFVGFRAELLRFPDQHLSIAIFANRGDANPSAMAYEVADILLKDKFILDDEEKHGNPAEEFILKEFELNQLVGNYELQPGALVQISIKNDSLNLLQSWNQSSSNLIKVSGNSYQLSDQEAINFTFSDLEEGMTQTLTYSQGDRKTKAVRKKEVNISGINLNNYVGTYYSKELDVIYIFELEKGILMARIENKETMECTIDDIDQFSFKLGLAKFQRINGAVSGFVLNSGRVKNLKFEKK